MDVTYSLPVTPRRRVLSPDMPILLPQPIPNIHRRTSQRRRFRHNRIPAVINREIITEMNLRTILTSVRVHRQRRAFFSIRMTPRLPLRLPLPLGMGMGSAIPISMHAIAVPTWPRETHSLDLRRNDGRRGEVVRAVLIPVSGLLVAETADVILWWWWVLSSVLMPVLVVAVAGGAVFVQMRPLTIFAGAVGCLVLVVVAVLALVLGDVRAAA